MALNKCILTEIETVIGYRTLSNKKMLRCLALMYQSRTFCSEIYHCVPYVENLFSISYMAYSKSIKSLSTFIHEAINKGEHTHRHLPLFTFTLISGDI